MTPEKSLTLHKKLKGKLEIKAKIALKTRRILSQVYTPGVAVVVRQINKQKRSVFNLTIKNNTVAVVTDGSAVLGLGNVGAEASIPVMEGKCIIFKEFAGLNAFPICLTTQNPEKIIETIKFISPVFAAINLEDIAAPKCFEIEEKLQNLGIPVVHDDQQATAIIVLAGLINAGKVTGKKLTESRIAVCGTGAAGTAVIKLLYFYGCRKITAVDSKGIIGSYRKDLSAYKKEIAKLTNKENIKGSLATACRNCDILIGVSQKGLFSENIIKSMNQKPIVFALANPDPEIRRDEAIKAGVYVYASGRSDDKNMINNALVFPGFFKGLIKWKINKATDQMKVNAATSISSLIVKPTKNHFIPDIFDKRLVKVITESLRN
ncbi:hypothetical protein A2W14_06070 [Candidatus Gottesmanbacteria bacterium RBG_16_37_8]|uniref:Malate dehydrogenase n=1 Tax=Candidatus Gottesmanbacteria bacterium RBG_16_37_8 TaxID=1798371 RepID=A0A1F5YV60_9BACT|nr:MAG: hypothetical protein A2W14_06070 [Candidatus Gottesmanbacteria bacterium RBG_16_37_8]